MCWYTSWFHSPYHILCLRLLPPLISAPPEKAYHVILSDLVYSKCENRGAIYRGAMQRSIKRAPGALNTKNTVYLRSEMCLECDVLNVCFVYSWNVSRRRRWRERLRVLWKTDHAIKTDDGRDDGERRKSRARSERSLTEFRHQMRSCTCLWIVF